MLFQLLRSVKKWVYNFFLNSDWADKEAQLYFRGDKDESNKG
jgi:hypothetical protein